MKAVSSRSSRRTTSIDRKGVVPLFRAADLHTRLVILAILIWRSRVVCWISPNNKADLDKRLKEGWRMLRTTNGLAE
jgi:hypothetical protein